MPPQPRHLRVFLASPGDVVDERELALKVLEGIRYDPLIRGKVTIEDVAWDKKGAGAPILAGITPQDSIKAGLTPPAECDIVVVLFWSRMGTPLPPEYVKKDGSRYLSGTEWEYHDAVDGFRRNGSPFVLLYRRTEKVKHDLDAADLHERIEQYERVKAFFNGLKNEDGSLRDGYGTYATPSEFGEKLGHDVKSLIVRILETPARTKSMNVAAPEPELWQGSPFPGLRAFTAADAPIFFGRERETDALIARVMEYPFVAVVGASGSGKSSLVAAGAMPRLELTAAGGRWQPITFTPDQLGTGDPFASTAAALLAAGLRQKNLARSLSKSPSHLRDRLRQFEARPLLFIDQFEELFTTVLPNAREPFIEMLRLVAECEAVRTVITLRADFYAKCVEHQALARLIESSTFPLSAPGVAALHEMIERPAARAGLTFEEALPQRILDDTGNEPGSLALMAYTLDELYRAASSGLLTHAAYEEIGGVQGAIGKRSEIVFNDLGEAEKAALPRVFRELVDVDERGTATRLRARLSRVTDSAAAARLTEALTEARLLVQSRGEDNKPVVEVAHEALFRSWSRLADWIKDAQEDLRLLRQVRTAAAEWDANGRRDDFLWSHERLAPVYAARDRLRARFEPPVSDFVRPEFERIADEIRKDRQYFRQRPHIERLSEIGAPAVPTLVHILRYATTSSAREEVFAALRRQRELATRHLIDACRDPDAEKLECYVEALERLAPKKAIALLRDLLWNWSPKVRSAAARLAAHLADPSAVPLLAERLSDGWSSVRASASIALATFRVPAAIDALLMGLRSTSEDQRRLTLELLLVLARHFKQVPPLRARSDADRRSLDPLLQAVSGTLAGDQRLAAIAQAVTPLLHDAKDDVALTATEALLAFGRPETTDALYQAINRNRLRMAEFCLRALTSMPSAATVGYLQKLLDDVHPGIAARTAREIAAVFDRQGDSKLREEILSSKIPATLLHYLQFQNPSQDLAAAAAEALVAIGWAPALPTFRRLFREGALLPIMIDAMAKLRDREAVPALVSLLSTTTGALQEKIANALLALDAAANAGPTAARALLTLGEKASFERVTPSLIRLVMLSEAREAVPILEKIARFPLDNAATETARKALQRLSPTSSRP